MALNNTAWSNAFIFQAQSDCTVYEWLCQATFPACHKLHYLQMWLEKLCKAYLWDAAIIRDGLPEFKTSHNVIAKVLPQLIKKHWRKVNYKSPPNFKAIRSLCRELDLLHPAVDDSGNRPDNVEYPWATFRKGWPTIIAPASVSFKVSKQLHPNDLGRKFIRAVTILTNKPNIWLTPETR